MFMDKKKYQNIDAGLTLVEVLIATSIILVFLLALFTVHNLYLKSAFSNLASVKGTFLVEEGLEAVRFLRDVSWSTNIEPLSVDADHGLIFSSGTWQVTENPDYTDGIFERSLTFSEVYRDAGSDIVSSGGTIDEDTKLVTVSVSWRDSSATSTKSISTYITNILDN